MKSITVRTACALATTAFAIFHAVPATATEGGASTYPAGVENYLTGAAPPPGFYVLEYLNVYSADKVRDDNGAQAPIPNFKLDAKVAATRLVWSTSQDILGGNLLVHAIIPVVDLKVRAGGAEQHRTNIGDITFGPAIGFHHAGGLHSVAALDIVAPTGPYNKGDLANISANHWSLQPVYTVSRIDPAGFNADFKAVLNFNRRNPATNYRSGTELYVDYAAGWGLGNGWTVGVGGYVTRQLSDDRLDGAVVTGARAGALAIGPSVKYDNGQGWFITAKLTQESSVRNRPDGTALWIKTILPF